MADLITQLGVPVIVVLLLLDKILPYIARRNHRKANGNPAGGVTAQSPIDCPGLSLQISNMQDTQGKILEVEGKILGSVKELSTIINERLPKR